MTTAVVADDSAVIRTGVVRILEDAGIEVVREARTADELLAAVDETPPDLAVVDIRMPPGGNAGLTAALDIRARYGDRVRVLVLSQYLEPEYALRLLGAGAGGVGYLLKDRLGEASELADAALRVAAGGSAVDPAVVDELVRARRTNDRLGRLTKREQEILALVAEGRSNRSIADALGLSAKTVEGAISVIFSKLGLEEDARDNRRVLAVLAYLDGRPAAASQPSPARRAPAFEGGRRGLSSGRPTPVSMNARQALRDVHAPRVPAQVEALVGGRQADVGEADLRPGVGGGDVEPDLRARPLVLVVDEAHPVVEHAPHDALAGQELVDADPREVDAGNPVDELVVDLVRPSRRFSSHQPRTSLMAR